MLKLKKINTYIKIAIVFHLFHSISILNVASSKSNFCGKTAVSAGKIVVWENASRHALVVRNGLSFLFHTIRILYLYHIFTCTIRNTFVLHTITIYYLLLTIRTTFNKHCIFLPYSLSYKTT